MAIFKSKAKSLHTREAELRERLAALRSERQEILDNLPEKKLERLRAQIEQTINEQIDLDKERKRLVAETPLPERYTKVIEAIKANMRMEHDIFNRAQEHEKVRSMPGAFICEDPRQTHMAEIDAAQTELDSLYAERSNMPSHLIPSMSMQTRINELNKIVGDRKRIERLCELGKELWELREDRKQLEHERDELQAERERTALAVA